MAATGAFGDHDAALPPAALPFDIYRDGQLSVCGPDKMLMASKLGAGRLGNSGNAALAFALPTGPCNYTDQTLPRCGCLRFWSSAQLAKSAGGDKTASDVETCMCSHHACFHEDVPLSATRPRPQMQQLPVPASPGSPGNENARPRGYREPLSPVLDMASFYMGSGLVASLESGDLLGGDVLQQPTSSPVARPHPQQLMDRNAAPSFGHSSLPLAGQESMPETMSWRQPVGLVANSVGGGRILMPSTGPPSTMSSSQARYLKPFAGQGLHTLSRGANGAFASRTHELLLAETDVGLVKDPEPPEDEERTKSLAAASGPSPKALQELAETLQSHEDRLDRLENPSFSVLGCQDGHQDCQEKHEGVDARVSELESRIEQVEHMLNDGTSSVGFAGGRDGCHDAAASIVSAATTTGQKVDDTSVSRADLYAQLQALRAQVNKLQAATPPSFLHPWELEVVFLPFPLKGIWIAAGDQISKSENTSMPNADTAFAGAKSSAFAAGEEWFAHDPDGDAGRVYPRAFVNGRVIDQRLRSRGLIKTVLVRGADARSVHSAITTAFADVLRVSASQQRPPGLGGLIDALLGLGHPWVPLRKVHKDSRLRFLFRSEMVTPALWNHAFLASSVVMKATGMNRLYVTTPEAYLQDSHYDTNPARHHTWWTWQKLRELSRVYPDSQGGSSGGDLPCRSAVSVPEADAMEECWVWSERLDAAPQLPGKLVHRHQQQHEKETQPLLFRASRWSSTCPSEQFFTLTSGGSPSLSLRSMERAASPALWREQQQIMGKRPSASHCAARPAQLRTASQSPRSASTSTSLPQQQAFGTSVGRAFSHVMATPAAQQQQSASVTKRRHQHHNPDHNNSIRSQTSIARRRVAYPPPSYSRSPSLAAGLARQHAPTPRKSRTSMSTSPSLVSPLWGGVGGDENSPPGPTPGPLVPHQHQRRPSSHYAPSERRVTPFAYATPASNAPGPPPRALQQRVASVRMGKRKAERNKCAGWSGGYDSDDEDGKCMDLDVAMNGYHDDEDGHVEYDEDEDDDDDDKDAASKCGCSTEPYESELGFLFGEHSPPQRRASRGWSGQMVLKTRKNSSLLCMNRRRSARGRSAFEDDHDVDMDVYEDEEEPDLLDEVEIELDASYDKQRKQSREEPGLEQEEPRPEDMPWLGIGDRMSEDDDSDGENIDPDFESNHSSPPDGSSLALVPAGPGGGHRSIGEEGQIIIHEDEAAAQAAPVAPADHQPGSSGGGEITQELENDNDDNVDEAMGDAFLDRENEDTNSSVPSEYPCTQRPWMANHGVGKYHVQFSLDPLPPPDDEAGQAVATAAGRDGGSFHIHEDGNASFGSGIGSQNQRQELQASV